MPAQKRGRRGAVDGRGRRHPAIATRRRRLGAVGILLARGAGVDARTAGGKTAYAHAARLGFDEVAALLRERGADT